LYTSYYPTVSNKLGTWIISYEKDHSTASQGNHE
jgi:hypothetical protein